MSLFRDCCSGRAAKQGESHWTMRKVGKKSLALQLRSLMYGKPKTLHNTNHQHRQITAPWADSSKNLPFPGLFTALTNGSFLGCVRRYQAAKQEEVFLWSCPKKDYSEDTLVDSDTFTAPKMCCKGSVFCDRTKAGQYFLRFNSTQYPEKFPSSWRTYNSS